MYQYIILLKSTFNHLDTYIRDFVLLVISELVEKWLCKSVQLRQKQISDQLNPQRNKLVTDIRSCEIDIHVEIIMSWPWYLSIERRQRNVFPRRMLTDWPYKVYVSLADCPACVLACIPTCVPRIQFPSIYPSSPLPTPKSFCHPTCFDHPAF